MKNIYITGTIPEDFQKASIIAIPKKTNAQTCEEHKTWSILPHILRKIIYRYIYNKVEENLPYEQFGFSQGKSIREVVFSLRLIIEKKNGDQ